MENDIKAPRLSASKPRVLVTLILVLGACAAGRAQDPTRSDPTLSVAEAQLRDLLQPMGVVVERPVAVADQSIQLQLRWNAAPAPPSRVAAARSGAGTSVSRLSTELTSPAGSIDILTRKTVPGPLPRRRGLNLAPDRILIVVVDSQSRLRSWSVIPDPRLIRAESPGPDGALKGTVVLRERPQFFINVPDDPSIRELRIYEPHWNGQAFNLVLIGDVMAK